MASTDPVETPAAETPAAPAADAAAGEEKPKEERPPLTPEEREKRKAERAEKRKEARKAAREAAKEAKARGDPPKPKAPKAAKAGGELTFAEGAAGKITVAQIPENATSADLTTFFGKYGTVLRAEVSKRKGRPTIGTIYFNTVGDAKKAITSLNGKKYPGEKEPISIQVAKDAVEWGSFVKKTTDEVAETLRQYKYKATVLKSKAAKDFINRVVFQRKKTPATELIAGALLVHMDVASAQELVSAKMINSAGAVQQLLKDEKAPAGKGEAKAAAKGKAEPKTKKLEKTFDAVVPFLDKLEKDRWNRMAKANLRLNERHRFRFVDILATPSLELWRWMVEDCEITPAEAGTCFAILQTYYGFTK